MSLSNAISSAVSGLRAGGLGVAVTAHNVANLATPGFVPDRVSTSSVVTGQSPNAVGSAGGGVIALVRPAIPLAGASVDRSNVDIASEFTRLIQAKAAYAQSLDLIAASERMLKRSVDQTA